MNLLLIKHGTFFTLSYILALIYNTGLTTAFNSRLEAVTVSKSGEIGSWTELEINQVMS